MKKGTYFILLIFLVLFINACQPQHIPSQPGAQINNQSAMPTATCAPDWFLEPPTAEDAIYGVGVAKMQNLSLAKKTAEARARDDIAFTIKTKVGAMMKDFMQQAGIGDDAQSLQLSQSVSKQIASVVLQGCKITKRKSCPEGMYSLAQWSAGQSQMIKQMVADQTKKLVKNEYALYNEFKAKQGFDALQQELDKLDLTEKQ